MHPRLYGLRLLLNALAIYATIIQSLIWLFYLKNMNILWNYSKW